MGFAVVIPAFNHRNSVVATIQSALGSDAVEEVIVVDDGSSDDTAAVVEGIDEPRVRLLCQANSGPSAARNTGARSATASHLVFLDVEDSLLPGSIEHLASYHDRGCRLVRSGAIRVEPDGSEALLLAESSEQPYPRGTPLPGTFSLERELFSSIGGYDEQLRYGENSELLLRAHSKLRGAAWRIGYCSGPTVRVSVNPAHDTDHYRRRRLEAIERVLQVHRREFERDVETWHNHHAVASVLYRQEGDGCRARLHGWAALRLRPWSARSWVRLAQAVVPSGVGPTRDVVGPLDQ